jgi:GT2 family glycosyltransferase
MSSRTGSIVSDISRDSKGSVKVSILMLTHNAPKYVERSIRTLAAYTQNVPYELVVVDNASKRPTRYCLLGLQTEGLIDRLVLLEYNSLFAGGNNIAASNAAPDSTHFLLLNSDIEVRHPEWLARLLEGHRRGITAYGVVDQPLRVDGYALLIDADLYRTFKLDENHQWFWAVTKLQARLLANGYAVQGIAEHERYLHHFGGKSGKAFRSAAGLVVSQDQLARWFGGRTIQVLDALPDGAIPPRPRPSFVDRLMARAQKMLP